MIIFSIVGAVFGPKKKQGLSGLATERDPLLPPIQDGPVNKEESIHASSVIPASVGFY